MNVCDLDRGKDGGEAWELDFFKSKTKYELPGRESLPNAVPRLPHPPHTNTLRMHTHSAKSIILIYGIKAPHWDLLSEAHIAALFLILLR